MIIAVDTSALGKLLVEEAESHALRSYLSDEARSNDEWVVSTLAVTELRRLAIRLDIDAARATAIVGRFRILRLTEAMLQLAGRLPYRNLGTLDAIHVATGLSVGAVGFVTYDARQADAAATEGLAVVSPGRPDADART